MSKAIPGDLIVFEMANNHMGDISHGVEIIRSFGRLIRDFPDFNFAFKLQYRDLDTFIHPSMRNRSDIKYIKRFSETRLTPECFDILVSEMRANNFLTMSTPFDEASVDLIEKQQLDFIKVASCSFGDWPLLERIARSPHSIIASLAGASVETIDQVVSFLGHRNKDFALMHCVGEYPTPREKMNLGQIDFLKNRYPGVRIGLSSHETPSETDLVKLAVAKGAALFERHVGVPTQRYELNAYSANPTQIRDWLSAARDAKSLCGVSNARLPVNPIEAVGLRSLRRGIFVNRDVQAGETISDKDVYFAFPPEEGQYTANDWSKYAKFVCSRPILRDAAVLLADCERIDIRSKVLDAVQQVKALLEKSKILVPGGVDLELSHHYGIDRFNEFGLTMMTVVNRGYCKKLLICLPNQVHPEQYHKQKEETFHVLYGEVEIFLDGVKRTYAAGDVVHVMPGVRHSFSSLAGCVIEEISSTHFANDSFYTDETIMKNTARKTLLTYWMQ